MKQTGFWYVILTFLLFIFVGKDGFATKPIELDTAESYYITSDFYRVVKDCDSRLNPEDVQFAPTAQEKDGAIFGCHGYWLEFSITNNTDKDRNWYLEITDPHIDSVAFYTGLELTGESGYRIPFSRRYFEHKNHQFGIALNAGETRKFLLRLNPHYDIGFSFLIRNDQSTLSYAQKEYWLLGMYYGIILIMALYNVFIFFSVRENVYLYYVLYALSCGIISFSEDGMGFQFLWPEVPYINFLIGYVGPILFLLSFVLYANSFLQTKKRWPLGFTLILGSFVFYLVLFTSHVLGWFDDKWKSFFLLIPFTVVLISAARIYSKGFVAARYFMLGCSFIVLSLIVFVLRIYNVVPINIFTIYSFNISFVLEVVILSIALGERLRIEKAEKEQRQKEALEQMRENQKLKDNINRELEIRIAERTKELQESNRELGNTKLEIEAAYAKLEMQAGEISRMNQILNADNKELKVNVKELSKARVMFKEVDFEEFARIYPDEVACLKYLSDIKWAKQYQCRKCHSDTYSEGRTPYSRRCTKCGYEESATAFTIFHRNRLPLNKAFYMVFLVSTSKKDISSEELSRKLDLRQKSCWAFKQKIVEAIQASNTKKFNPENWGNLFLNQ